MELKNYYKQSELEFLMLLRQFRNKIEDGSILKDENSTQFIEVLQSMADSLKDIVQLRIETEEMDTGRQPNAGAASGNCPTCLDVVPASIVGETTNSLGYHVNLLECEHCSTTFEDYLPNREEEMLCWYENFFHQMSLAEESGEDNNRFGIPNDEVNAIHKLYEELKIRRESVKASKEELERVEKTSDQQMKEVTRYLYVIYGHVISGNESIALN